MWMRENVRVVVICVLVFAAFQMFAVRDTSSSIDTRNDDVTQIWRSLQNIEKKLGTINREGHISKPPTSSSSSFFCEAQWKIARNLECNECKNGYCFIGECYCKPGYGPHNDCKEKEFEPPKCIFFTSLYGPIGAEDCYYNPEYGIGVISMERWSQAQKAEADLWASLDATEDRAENHAQYFNYYKDLPSDLGLTLETGCGPYTQTKTVIKYGKVPKRLFLTDPGMPGYFTRVKNCPYKEGTLDGVPATLMTVGTEELEFYEKFDTVIMINVIEHVWNGFEVLEAVYRALKPGGLFMFAERVLWPKAKTEMYHPIRYNLKFYNHFLEKYSTIFRFNGTTTQMVHSSDQVMDEVYFVGRKKIMD